MSIFFISYCYLVYLFTEPTQNLAAFAIRSNQEFYRNSVQLYLIFFYPFSRVFWSNMSYICINFFWFFPRWRARSTLSALRLSKLSRRDETRLSCETQILRSFFSIYLEQPAAWSSGIKAIKRAHHWRSARGQFYIIPSYFYILRYFLSLLFAAFQFASVTVFVIVVFTFICLLLHLFVEVKYLFNFCFAAHFYDFTIFVSFCQCVNCEYTIRVILG